MNVQVFKIYKWRVPDVAIWFVPEGTRATQNVENGAGLVLIPVFVLHRPKNYQEIKFVPLSHPIWEESLFPPDPLEVWEAYQICGGAERIQFQLAEALLEVPPIPLKQADLSAQIPPHEEVGRFKEI